jgi:hypothetical protein
VTYLQAHMTRRHPDYHPSKRREHDVDVEKETQRLKDELNKKDNELQLIKVQKVCSKQRPAGHSRLRYIAWTCMERVFFHLNL